MACCCASLLLRARGTPGQCGLVCSCLFLTAQYVDLASLPFHVRCRGWDSASGTAVCGPSYRGFACSGCVDGYWSRTKTVSIAQLAAQGGSSSSAGSAADGACQPCPDFQTTATYVLVPLFRVTGILLAVAAVILGLVLTLNKAGVGGGRVRCTLAAKRAARFFLNTFMALQVRGRWVGGQRCGVAGAARTACHRSSVGVPGVAR